MDMNQSETLFEEYLNKKGIKFFRDFPVNSHNVDFRLTKGEKEILCDVKEVRDSEIKLGSGAQKSNSGCLDAQDHLRGI